MKQKILISGSSGLVGSTLVNHFKSAEHDVWRLVRRDPGQNEIFWQPANHLLEPAAIEDFDIIIHLAGENISGHRWTQKFKSLILKSRINSTSLLANTIAQLENKPKLFICASATGYYGNRADEPLTELSPAGNSFLSDVVNKWEDAAYPAVSAGVRTVYLRFGVILSTQHGALSRLLPIFKLGLGGTIGSGKQYMPWVSIDEIAPVVEFIISNHILTGPVNVVSPQSITNKEFTKIVANTVNRPAIFKVPGFILKSTLGEMADELLLSSTKVIPQKLINAGYLFNKADLEIAIQTIINSE